MKTAPTAFGPPGRRRGAGPVRRPRMLDRAVGGSYLIAIAVQKADIARRAVRSENYSA